MASNLKQIIVKQADAIESASGTDKAMAILAFASFLTSRALTIFVDVQSRGNLDDQAALDLAKKHDQEAKDAWAKLQAETV